MLGLFDWTEVDAVHEQFRRTQRPEALAYLLVDQAVILGAGLPAHAADQADGAHIVLRLSGEVRTYSARDYATVQTVVRF
ncbi:hypothetical protein D3C85_1234570 [compost metagenome]